MTRNERILAELKAAGKSQADLATKLGVTRAAISDRLNGEKQIDSFDFLMAVSELTGKSPHWLHHGDDGPPAPEARDYKPHFPNSIVNEPGVDKKYLKGSVIRTVAVTVDRSGNDLMTYVPVKAQAGYMAGHGDPKYIASLPAFSLPILKTGQYRMFEVDGDSMLQMGGGGLHDGDIVISQYVEDIFSLKDNRVYVVVTNDHRPIVKRCLNRLKDSENAILVCKSDNKNGQYNDIIVRAHEIIEVWELKAYLSKQLSFGTDLWQMMNDVEVKLALMQDKINRIDSQNLLK